MIQASFASILLDERRAPSPRRRRPTIKQTAEPQGVASRWTRLHTSVLSTVHRRQAWT